MFSLIENFYEPNDLGLIVLGFLNYNFNITYQSDTQYYQDRLQAYPCYETQNFKKDHFVYQKFTNTFQNKTNINVLHCETFLRKVKLNEFKKSASWGKQFPHTDGDTFDLAGLIYFNSNSIKDGTLIYNKEIDFEPTVIIGSKINRCVFYNTLIPHSPSNEQLTEERWTQPFFLITKEETFKKYKESNGT